MFDIVARPCVTYIFTFLSIVHLKVLLLWKINKSFGIQLVHVLSLFYHISAEFRHLEITGKLVLGCLKI